MSRGAFWLAATVLPLPTAAVAQMDMSHMGHMPGMQMPAAKPPAKKPAEKKPAPKTAKAAHPSPPKQDTHQGHAQPMHDMPMERGGRDMPGMDMSGHHDMAMPSAEPAEASGISAPTGTDLAAGSGPAPAPPVDHAADAAYAPAAMAHARMMLHHEHGGMTMHRILFNLAEAQFQKGLDDYRWDAEGWIGGDIDRFVAKSEGRGGFGGRTEEAEIQALYSRAIGPYFDLQGGVRQDVSAGPKRTYATVGIEGLAPYWFEVEAQLFLSDKGDALGRIEGWHDLRLAQRVVLQPRAELNFAAQDVRAQRIGSGLTEAELGLRLRYEIKREFAPYAGLSWTRKAGATARYARQDGERASQTTFVVGTRLWF